ADQHIGLELTDEAAALLAERGYDPVYGARPLARTLQRLVETPVGRMIVKGEVTPGQTLRVRAVDGEIALEAVEPRTLARAETGAPQARPATVARPGADLRRGRARTTLPARTLRRRARARTAACPTPRTAGRARA